MTSACLILLYLRKQQYMVHSRTHIYKHPNTHTLKIDVKIVKANFYLIQKWKDNFYFSNIHFLFTTLFILFLLLQQMIWLIFHIEMNRQLRTLSLFFPPAQKRLLVFTFLLYYFLLRVRNHILITLSKDNVQFSPAAFIIYL